LRGRGLIAAAERTAVAAIALLAIAAIACADEQSIRVGLRYGAHAPTSVTIGGAVDWKAERGGGRCGEALRLTAEGDGVRLSSAGAERDVGGWVEVNPAGSDPWLELDGSAYRGRLRIEAQQGGRLKIVNIVAVEDYVRGVLANEMFPDDEAYKVQAVISRTLAVYIRDVEQRHAAEGFDVCTAGHCQVYRGVDSETPDSNAAVAATAGQVLTWRGRVIFAAYHSNAGGATEGVDAAWPGSVPGDFPYLQRVESPYDAEARTLPGYEWCYGWDRTISGADVRSRLGVQRADIGEVRDVVVRGRTPSGRVSQLDVIGSLGRVRVRGTDAVCALLDTPSALFDVTRIGSSFRVRGRGLGHGVGLSQQGALGMARAGYTYAQILGHYYAGVALTEDYGGGASVPLRPPERPR